MTSNAAQCSRVVGRKSGFTLAKNCGPNHVSFKFPNSPIFLAPQFLGDPEPMDNFVVPTGSWSDATPDRCKQGHLSAASESLSDAGA
jgi:hypothetical protein